MQERIQYKLLEKKDKYIIYLLEESLSAIEPRFLTDSVFLYLLVGEKKAMLVDTGSGIYNLDRVVSHILGQHNLVISDLVVICTHDHFDHIGGAYLFDNVHIYNKPAQVSSIDLSFLKGSPGEDISLLEKLNFSIPLHPAMKPLVDGQEFDLGGISLTIKHTPGHTPGCVSLISDNGHLFTGDAFHLGTIYLPAVDKLDQYIDTLQDIYELALSHNLKIFPGHSDRPLDEVQPSIIQNLVNAIRNIDLDDKVGHYNPFLESQVFENQGFTFVLPR